MKKEKVYKTIHLLYTGAVFTALAIGFSRGLLPLVLICLVSAPVYYQFIKRWRRKRGVVRTDERMTRKHKRTVFISFWIVFMVAFGFYYVLWGLGKYDLVNQTWAEYGQMAGLFGLFTFTIRLSNGLDLIKELARTREERLIE